jgi:hypothetical protein
MNALHLSLYFLLLAGTALRADPPAAIPPTATDPLAEALPILQAKYIDFKALNFKEGDHLSDLIVGSKGEISLIAPSTASAFVSAPILTASLPGGIIYWRLASFIPAKSWLEMKTQLEQAGPDSPGIILDLRSNVAPDDYAGAAQVLDLFAPADPTLSKYKTAGPVHGVTLPGHPFHPPMIVLANHQTTGAAEALAACLKADGALVVGQATSGTAALFEEHRLSSGQILRFATAPIFLADGTPLWGHPVAPDIGLTVNARVEKGALMLIQNNHISEVIQESAERHRMSEASLVQGDDPEWDDYLASLEKKPDAHFLLSLPPIHDVVLISAIDSLKAIRVSQRSLPAPPRAGAVSPTAASLQ